MSGTSAEGVYRFYGDLAPWWPLISPPEEYEEESAFVARLLARAAIPVRDVLELGSGGGHVASFLKRHYRMTLVDLSDEMLDVSRRLNPDCSHVQGDMRSIRLNRPFDAVFVYDAIDYMTTESDLGRAIETALLHCRPGGVALFVPDHVTEDLELGADHGGSDGADGRSVRFLEWSVHAGPNLVRTDYVFLFREPNGDTKLGHETHHTGVYPLATWLRLIDEAGFEPEVVREETSEDRLPRHMFLAHRPR